MVDNVTLNAGSGGATVKTDDDGSAHWQYVKVAYGPDDTQTRVTAAAGMPVTPDSSGFTVTANLGTLNGAMLGTDFSSVFGSVSLVTATQADNLVNTTDAVNVASLGYVFDGTAWDRLRGDATNGMLVDLGANNDVSVTGTVTVDGSGVTQPVSAASLPLPTGAATSAGQLPDGHNVTVDNASGASAVNIQDGGNSITVDGTVTANLSATDNTVLDNIDSQTAAIQVAAELSDDVVLADDAAFTLTTSKVSMAGAIRDDALSSLAAVEGDAVPLRVNSTGALHVTGGGGGTEYTDDTSTHSSGASAGSLLMAAATPSDGAVDSNDIGAVAMSTDRRLHTDAQIVGQDANLTVDLGTVDNAVLDNIDSQTAAIQTATELADDVVFADDAAFTLASSKVSMAGAIRDDSLSSLTAIEGDAVPLRVNSTGALHVTGGGGGTEYTDDTSTHATGSSAGSLLMAAATPTDGSVDANDIGAVAMSLDRRLHVDADITASVALDVSAATVTVDGSGVTQPVSAATLPLPTGAATSALQLPDGHNVTVDNAAGASAVNIQDGGNSITVDGTVTANLSATDNTVLDNIDTQTAATQTAVELIDDAIYTDDTSTHATGTSKGIGVMAAAVPTDTSVEANDIAMVAMSTDRRLHTDTQIVGQDANLTVDLGTTDNTVLDNIDTQTAAIQTAVEILDDWDETNRAAVNIIAGQAGIAGGTGTDGATVPRVTLATDVALPAGTNNIGDVDVASIAAGANLVGDVGLSGARTSGGTTLYKNIDVDESEDAVKATAGQVYWIHAMNLSASTVYLKLYNATVATVVVGTTTPDLTFPVPTQGDTNGAGFVLSIPNGIAFGTAITIAATTGLADADSGAPAANALVVNLGYA